MQKVIVVEDLKVRGIKAGEVLEVSSCAISHYLLNVIRCEVDGDREINIVAMEEWKKEFAPFCEPYVRPAPIVQPNHNHFRGC